MGEESPGTTWSWITPTPRWVFGPRRPWQATPCRRLSCLTCSRHTRLCRSRLRRFGPAVELTGSGPFAPVEFLVQAKAAAAQEKLAEIQAADVALRQRQIALDEARFEQRRVAAAEAEEARQRQAAEARARDDETRTIAAKEEHYKTHPTIRAIDQEAAQHDAYGVEASAADAKQQALSVFEGATLEVGEAISLYLSVWRPTKFRWWMRVGSHQSVSAASAFAQHRNTTVYNRAHAGQGFQRRSQSSRGGRKHEAKHATRRR